MGVRVAVLTVVTVVACGQIDSTTDGPTTTSDGGAVDARFDASDICATCASNEICDSGCRLPIDCEEALAGGISTGDGVYEIDPTLAPADDRFPIFCDMTLDGGGWTLVAKTNGMDLEHFGDTPRSAGNLTTIDLATSGYVGDVARVAIGQFYRVHCWNGQRYAYVTNTMSFNESWGFPQQGVLWSATYSPSPIGYTETSADDCGSNPGSCVGIAYNGRNWARQNTAGCRIFGNDSYGGRGFIFVK